MRSKLRIASLLLVAVTLLLKVSGLIRDQLITFYFGAGSQADAYYAAFALPNMFILFLTTGMKSAFVPSYIKQLEQNRGSRHFHTVWKGTLGISLLISIVFGLLAPVYIQLLYPGLNDQAADLATALAIIFLASIVFVGVNAVLEAYFDAENKYYLSVLAQAIVLISTIVSAFLFADNIGTYAFAYGNLAGVIISLLFKLVLLAAERKIGWDKHFDRSAYRAFFKIFIPVALTAMVGQITLLMDTTFANLLGSSYVTYLNIAKNLTQFPQNIIGVTVGTIVFPLLAAAFAKKDYQLFQRNVSSGLQAMYLVLLPALAGMMVLMPDIVSFLYERGAFAQQDVNMTSLTAYFYFGTILFYSLNIVVNNGFYTMEKGHIIMRLGFLSILLKLILNFLFTAWFGFVGIPLSSSVTGLIYAAACFFIFRRLIGGFEVKTLSLEFAKITLAAAVMTGIILAVIPVYHSLGSLAVIILTGIIGAAVYSIMAFVLRIQAVHLLLGSRKSRDEA